MHGSPTRARGKGQGRRPGTAALFLATFAAAGLLGGPSAPRAAAPATSDPITTASLAPAKATHELRIELTRPGHEALELAARLDQAGGLITRPIGWSVKRTVAGREAAGDAVYRGEAPVTEVRLAPGEYRVEASYGFAKVGHDIAVEPGQRVGVTLILNVGGIRALSLVDGQPLPAGIAADHAVYAMSGPQAGDRLTAAARQGEVLRVAAGTYRIESRLRPGNTVTETTVAVKPGRLSSLEIAHLAAVVRVEAAGEATGWQVENLDSGWTWRQTGAAGDLVLAPGRYQATAIGAAHPAVSFTVAAGQSVVVLIGR